jgi:beta-glucosidase/6-phospho-beta-glucosidase/beta-galactosidase
MLHLGAFESTHIVGSGTDVLETTKHLDRWQSDLTLLHESGIRALRYPAPWHRVEPSPGAYDFSWLDGPLCWMRDHGLEPILDPLHHTSFPEWLDDGFANPEFSSLYSRFLGLLAERYPWVRDWTVFNEPLPTTVFCSQTGLWYPYQTGDPSFVAMTLNVARAICEGTRVISERIPKARFVYIDTCEHHSARDSRTESAAWFFNERRFLIHELVLGRVDSTHALHSYLIRNGAPPDDLASFRENPGRIDLLGLDYYPHSELEWFTGRARNEGNLRNRSTPDPRGFAEVARDYIDRFQRPVFLGETNIRGFVTDRLTWLRFMEEQAERLEADGTPLEAFCWFPSIDSTDWCHLCTKCTRSVDPQGIWWLDGERWDRHESELSHTYRLLAQGKIRSTDIAPYYLQAPVDRQLAGYQKFMRDWSGWREPETARRDSGTRHRAA